MAKKKKIRILELSPAVFDTYRNRIRGNENITYELACKKMTRNLLLGEEEFDPYNHNEDVQMYSYGFMQFKVKGNRVIWLKPKARYPVGWEKDWGKHKELTIKLGIE